MSIFCGGGFDVDRKIERTEVLQYEAGAPDFWDDADTAQKKMRELSEIQSDIAQWERLSNRLSDALILAEMEDEELASELETETLRLTETIDDLEFRTLFSGKFDKKNAYLAIHSGAGGTESQDWAAMLRRMMLRWAEGHGFEIDTLDETAGDEVGIKSTTFLIKGEYAFGWLRSERGVHRLVRISPFDSSARRHTSFVKMEVWPDVAREIEIEIDEGDLKIDRFKASGAGGQHVQKNETAIRITHLPTGIVVSCQNQRSLTQNLETAMNILKVQLYELEMQKQQDQIDALKGDNVSAEWGNQIRSYVLHPYKMVKDHRTNHETGDPSKVLDGSLDGFMEAYLRYTLGE